MMKQTVSRICIRLIAALPVDKKELQNMNREKDFSPHVRFVKGLNRFYKQIAVYAIAISLLLGLASQGFGGYRYGLVMGTYAYDDAGLYMEVMEIIEPFDDLGDDLFADPFEDDAFADDTLGNNVFEDDDLLAGSGDSGSVPGNTGDEDGQAGQTDPDDTASPPITPDQAGALTIQFRGELYLTPEMLRSARDAEALLLRDVSVNAAGALLMVSGFDGFSTSAEVGDTFNIIYYAEANGDSTTAHRSVTVVDALPEEEPEEPQEPDETEETEELEEAEEPEEAEETEEPAEPAFGLLEIIFPEDAEEGEVAYITGMDDAALLENVTARVRGGEKDEETDQPNTNQPADDLDDADPDDGQPASGADDAESQSAMGQIAQMLASIIGVDLDELEENDQTRPAAPGDDGAIAVHIVDRGGLDWEATPPENTFTVTYGAYHPETGELVMRERQVVVVMGIMPLNTMPPNVSQVGNILYIDIPMIGGDGGSVSIDDPQRRAQDGWNYVMTQISNPSRSFTTIEFRFEDMNRSSREIPVTFNSPITIRQNLTIRTTNQAGSDQQGNGMVMLSYIGSPGTPAITVESGTLNFGTIGLEQSSNSRAGTGIRVNGGATFEQSDSSTANHRSILRGFDIGLDIHGRANRLQGMQITGNITGIKVNSGGVLSTITGLNSQGLQVNANDVGIHLLSGGNATISRDTGENFSQVRINANRIGILVDGGGLTTIARDEDNGTRWRRLQLLNNTEAAIRLNSGTVDMRGGIIDSNSGATSVEINGGTFTVNANAQGGRTRINHPTAPVMVNGGTFTMRNGIVWAEGRAAPAPGAGVTVKSGGTFNLEDNGAIENRVTGIAVEPGATVNIRGGIVRQNTTGISPIPGVNITGGAFRNNEVGINVDGEEITIGGTVLVEGSTKAGVLVTNSGNLTLNSNSANIDSEANQSRIRNNGVAVGADGNVTVSSGSAFTMNGGMIGHFDHTQENSTKGVRVHYGTFTMNGGAIQNIRGIGVDLESGGVFVMEDGTVYNRTGGSMTIGVRIGYAPTSELARFTLRNGTISARSVGVHANSGSFTMEGGTIHDSHVGLLIDSGNTHTMSGGSISDNVIGVWIRGSVNPNAAFTMSGGKITGNHNPGQNGGGVLVEASRSFAMTGGEISGNSARQGGGVYVGPNATFSSGGEISGNTAFSGGGVYIDDSAQFGITTGGKISGNNAEQGGGVYVRVNDNVFTLSAGEISGNSAGQGGGVYVEASRSFAMTGGEISGNTARDSGGGIFVEHTATVALNAGRVINNIAQYGAGLGWQSGAPSQPNPTDPDHYLGALANVSVLPAFVFSGNTANASIAPPFTFLRNDWNDAFTNINTANVSDGTYTSGRHPFNNHDIRTTAISLRRLELVKVPTSLSFGTDNIIPMASQLFANISSIGHNAGAPAGPEDLIIRAEGFTGTNDRWSLSLARNTSDPRDNFPGSVVFLQDGQPERLVDSAGIQLFNAESDDRFVSRTWTRDGSGEQLAIMADHNVKAGEYTFVFTWTLQEHKP